MRIAIAANTGWYLYNFRRTLMAALRDAGHRPVAISPHDEYVDRLIDEGFDCIDFPLDGASVNPLRELSTVRRLRRLLVGGCFDAAFTYTPKANIYFGLAAKGMRIQHVPNVSGLGRVFIAVNWVKPVVMRLYRQAFSAARVIIFQNGDDEREFVEQGLVRPERTLRVPGSGVDLVKFSPAPWPTSPRGHACTVFLFIGRILADKGVLEFVEAARRVKAQRPGVVFQLLGSLGAQNPTAIAPEQLQDWVQQGWVEYLGATDDVRPAIAKATCVVLPSYREGLPRVLLEAAAMARPCIATDVPGCRDAVDADITGLFCRVRDAQCLTDTLLRFVNMPQSQQQEMGRQGRLKVEREFDEHIVLRTYVGLASDIAAEELAQRRARPARPRRASVA
jgi:glycosyltransferase involved in cell wall biosynthesis